MSVSHLAVICKAGQLKPVFNEKTVSARKMYVSHFRLLKNNLVQRVVMHYFAAPFRAYHLRCKGLHEVDCHQVNKQQLCTCTQEPRIKSSQYVVQEPSMCTSIHIIKPIVVYERTRGGFTKKKIPHHHQGTHHAVQKKAWFDEVTMLDWVKNVLAPNVAKFPTGIIPILFLDSFKVHLLGSGSVANAPIQ